MRRFSEDFIQRVFSSSNIVDIISADVQLTNKGGRLWARCPYPSHNEKSASFTVDEAKQVFYCFGCHNGGGIIHYLRDIRGLNFPQAIEFLANRANIELPTQENVSPEEERQASFTKQILRANQLALEYFEQNLRSQSPESVVAKYVIKRGIDPDIIQGFKMGLSGSAWDGLASFLQQKGVNPEAAVAAGLIKKRKEGQGHFDMFRERLMFPIHKMSGEVIGFGGRILESGEPKYLNSPDTPVFHKGKTLYGLDQTARHVRSKDQIIVVEGYMDLLTMFQFGFKNVGAPLGTALTTDHAYLISKLTKNVVVLFDGDEAGKNAAEKSLPILLHAGLRPRGLMLPGGLDPDDFLKSTEVGHGSEGLQKLLEQAPDLFNLVVGRWTLNFRGSSTDKLALVERCQPVLEQIKDPRLKELYKNDLAQKLQLMPAQLGKMLDFGKQDRGQAQRFHTGNPTQSPNEISKSVSSGSQSPENSSPIGEQVPEQDSEKLIVVGKMPKAEKILISLGIKNRANLEQILSSNVTEHLKSPSAKEIFHWIFTAYRQNPTLFDSFSSLLASKVDEPSVLFETDRMAANNQFSESDLQIVLRDCIRKVLTDSLKEQMDRLSMELKLQPSPEGMQQLLQFQKERAALLSQISNQKNNSDFKQDKDLE